MGDAKRRGSFEQRKAEAIAAKRRPGMPERTEPYKQYLRLSTPALDYMWRQFRAVGDKTLGEIHAEIEAQRAALKASE